MERKYEVGASIIFIDAHSVRRPALVTKWWGDGKFNPPGCNLVIVSDDENQSDGYGRQIQRHTSVVYKTMQSAPGWCWCWPDEV